MKMNADINDQLKNQINQMSEIIDGSINDHEEAELLKKLFSKISDYNMKHLDDVISNVRKSFSDTINRTDRITVKNVLAERSDAVRFVADNVMDYVVSPEKLGIGVFIDLSYSELVSRYKDKKYKVTICTDSDKYDFRATLVQSTKFVRAEKILKKLAEQYNISMPLIYMPYARKYFELKIKDCDIPKESITDIIIEGIPAECVKPDCKYFLMWNISIKEISSEPTYIEDSTDGQAVDTVVPYFDHLKYKRKYLNIQPDEYYIFKIPDYEKFCISRENDKIVLYTEKKFTWFQAQKLTLLSGNIDSSFNVYSNYFRKNTLFTSRVRTYADIEYVIDCFRDNPFDISIGDKFKIEYHSDMGKINTIKNYDVDYAYYYHDSEDRNHNIKLKSSVNCILTFSGGKNTEDFADYVLEFLNISYPEFNWQGELQ